MSDVAPGEVTCPRCRRTWEATLFTCVDADTIDVQVEAIREGRFELRTCEHCGHAFRPEHSMLFVSHARGLWIVMQPMSDRARFAEHEHDVAFTIRDEIARATPIVAERLSGVRPRLVFGQHMLAEAVRTAYAGIDASLLECSKLLAARKEIARLFAGGPFELCYERTADDGAFVCAIHALRTGERTGELTLPRVLTDGDPHGRLRDQLRGEFPDLFDRPYVSATRYLIGSTL